MLSAFKIIFLINLIVGSIPEGSSLGCLTQLHKSTVAAPNLVLRKVRYVATCGMLCLNINFGYSSAAFAKVNDPKAVMRFEAARDELSALNENWDSIVKGQGDNIRRRLGTVYTPPTCSSSLCGISAYATKFAQSHVDDDDFDFPTFAEGPINDFNTAYNQADFMAYSSVFADSAGGGLKSETYIDNSRGQVKRAIKAMNEVIKFLND